MTFRALSWDDVCLIPQYSEIVSRSDPDTSMILTGKCYNEGHGINLEAPIIASNMDTLTESEMAIAMWRAGAMGALHRFMPLEKLVQEYRTVRANNSECLVTLGLNWESSIRDLYAAGARKFVIDIAHGHCVMMRHALLGLRKFAPDIFIMAGNVATPEGVVDLAKWGADVVKVGVGGGSICKTRIVTGHGVPMFSCVRECSQAADIVGVQIVADGGIKSSGDIVKAFVAGADAVMVGSLLAGTTETPGEIIQLMIDGKQFKRFRGMASAEAQEDRQWGTPGVKVAPEGVSTTVPYRGPVAPILHELTMGLKSGMSYCNASNLQEIFTKARWREQSHSAYVEGTPHILKH